MRNIVAGAARAGLARLLVTVAKRCRFALPGTYVAAVLGVCNPHVVYGSNIDVTEHLKVRLGVNNLTDRKPPVIGFAANPLLVNGNMAAGIYDALGRYLFAGLTARF